jgi:hypothetical protein
MPPDGAAVRPDVGEARVLAERRAREDEQHRAVEPRLQPDQHEHRPAGAERQGERGEREDDRVDRRAARPHRAAMCGDEPHAEVGGLEHAARPEIEPDRVDLHRTNAAVRDERPCSAK